MMCARSNRTGFEQRFLNTLRDLGVTDGRRLTVGFSGGYDSLALAAGLARIAPTLRFACLLVHVDHRLRPASARNAEACRELAVRLKMPLEVVALQTGMTERARGIGLEEAARRERYLALATAAAKWESSTILLGHQSNDQAETVLMHLFRGAGLDGLAGMHPKESRRIPWWTGPGDPHMDVTLLRPLLGETRTAIEEYVEAIGLHPVEDESNSSVVFDRNWVRHNVLPVVLERWPSAIETIQRSALALEYDGQFLEELANAAFSEAANDDRTLRTDILIQSPRPIAYRVLRRWLYAIGLDEVDLDVVARLYDLATRQDERPMVEVGGGSAVVVADDRLTTLDELCRRVAPEIPLVPIVGQPDWVIDISDDLQSSDAILTVPEGAELQVRTVETGDNWFGGNRSVMEDLRVAGIHPLLRTRLLAVAIEEKVLLIPAIYPTIRAAGTEVPEKKVGVRWSKRS